MPVRDSSVLLLVSGSVDPPLLRGPAAGSCPVPFIAVLIAYAAGTFAYGRVRGVAGDGFGEPAGQVVLRRSVPADGIRTREP